jgi:adenine phosphoribosyltransferase
MLSEKIIKAIAEIPDFPKPGISFKDITPILASPELSKELVENMARWARPLNPEYIVGIESRGFMLGFALAQKLDIGFIPVRKPGKLPREVYSQSYDLEYGSATVELHKEDIKPGARVIIHDDLLATGGTAEATAKLCSKAQAEVVGMHFIIELSFLKGRQLLPAHTNVLSEVIY